MGMKPEETTPPIWLTFATMDQIASELASRPNAWFIFFRKTGDGGTEMLINEGMPEMEVAQLLAEYAAAIIGKQQGKKKKK